MSAEVYDESLCLSGSEPSHSKPSFLNVGTGKDCTIKEVAAMIRKVVGYHGEIRYDTVQPDGTPRKLLDVSRLTSQGWQPNFSLASGLKDTYDWYCHRLASP